MKIAAGIIAGLVWGVLAALLNLAINKKALAKNDAKTLMAANLARTAVDVAALGAVFLVRKLLPFPYEAVLIGTAISLSLLTVFFAYRLAGNVSKQDKQE